MIKTVLFDMDGTLVNSEKHYIDGTFTWLKRLGYTPDYYETCKIVGMTMDDIYKHLSKLTGESYELIQKTNEDYFLKENPVVYRNYIFDDVLPTLKMLKEKGITIIICSMSSSSYIEDCISQLGLHDYIDYYIGGDIIKKAKPDPEAYLKAVEKYNLDKKECVVVEDSYNGILASKNAGILTCARKDYQFGIDQSLADIILESLTDLIKVIENV